MNAKTNKNINSKIEQLSELFKFENNEERIELKASLIQLDILEEVKKIMAENDISRSQLAVKLKVSKSFVSQLFSGDKLLNLKMIAQFQELFNAKFIPGFKNYSDLNNSVNFDKNDYINYDEYTKNAPIIFQIQDYPELKAA